MNPKKDIKDSQIGQGFNDARGEIPDKKDTPKNNGQNVNNDPSHYRVEENKSPDHRATAYLKAKKISSK